MDIIAKGTDYKELPDTYVIFICDFDPFGFGKYKYTFDMICTETGEMLDDGARTIFLSTKGTNGSEVPEGLRKFLRYVAADAAPVRRILMTIMSEASRKECIKD